MRLIAHRGASGYAPENTLISFKKAFEMGAREVEFDVQMTKDGQLVVIHDFFLDRTTSGSGMVMTTHYTDIQKLDAGSWFDKAFDGEKVPLLSEVIDVCIAESSRKNWRSELIMHIEIKKPKLEQRAVELAVLELVLEKNCLEQVVFSSFLHSSLKSLLSKQAVKVGVLIGSEILRPMDYLARQELMNYSINQSAEFIDLTFVKEAHEAGIQVLSYTVNNREIALYFDSLGVDGIFCNYPDLLSR